MPSLPRGSNAPTPAVFIAPAYYGHAPQSSSIDRRDQQQPLRRSLHAAAGEFSGGCRRYFSATNMVSAPSKTPCDVGLIVLERIGIGRLCSTASIDARSAVSARRPTRANIGAVVHLLGDRGLNDLGWVCRRSALDEVNPVETAVSAVVSATGASPAAGACADRD